MKLPHKLISTLGAVVLAMALVPAAAFAQAEGEPAFQDAGSYAPDEVVVVYEDSAAGEKAADGAAQRNLERVIDVESVEEIAAEPSDDAAMQVMTLEDGEDLDEAVARLNSTPGVAFAQKNYAYQLLDDGEEEQTGSADPYASQQYYLNSWDATFQRSCGANVTEAWDMIEGASTVTVAVLDTGCQTSHEDLSENIDVEHAYNAVTSRTGAAAVNDESGHGTHVCGIIAATSNNGKGISGVGNNLVRVVPIKVFEGSNAYTSDLVKAYKYLKSLMDSGELSDLHAINMSLGGYGEMDEDDLTLDRSMAQMKACNVLTVVAGGNGNNYDGYTEKMFPADLDSAFAVTALEKNGTNSRYSDYNQYKDISAPGSNVFSTLDDYHSSASYQGENATYGNLSGTSMAAPVVSAIVALLWADNPDLTCSQVTTALTSTAHKVNPSRNDRSGLTGSAGAVDAAAALNYSVENYPSTRVKFTDAQVTLSQDSVIYGSSDVTPGVSVSFEGIELSCGTDYVVKYRNYKSVGTAQVVVTGIGAYRGSITISYEVVPADVANVTVTLSPSSYTYDGEWHFPEVKVTYAGAVLKWGTDFGVEAPSTNCISVGTHTLTINGKGNYTGSVTASFTIEEAAAEEVVVTPTVTPVTRVVINKKTVYAKDVRAAAAKGATIIELGPKVRKIKAKAFKGTGIKKLVVKTTKLKKKYVKNALKGSKVKYVKVKKSKYKAYKKVFAKSVVGKKVKVCKSK